MGLGMFLCVDIHLQRWPEDRKNYLLENRE